MSEVSELKRIYWEAVDIYLRTPFSEREELEPIIRNMERTLRTLGVDI